MTSWRIADRTLEFPPPLAVGIVNVTDDSFFEGARSGTPEAAIEDGLALVADGFDLLDVGAVPARSGPPVPPEEEAERIVPTVEGLVGAGVPVAVDTFSAEVADRALDAGAAIVNDISGGSDPALIDLVADRGCGYVLMHIEGPPRVDRAPPPPRVDAVAELRAWFEGRVAGAVDRGVAEEQIALDPGLDFDLGVDDDLAILRDLRRLRELGRPLFVALSRKDFLGAVLAGSWEERLPAGDREWATTAATALAVREGADLVRLHDRSALDSLRVAGRIIYG